MSVGNKMNRAKGRNVRSKKSRRASSRKPVFVLASVALLLCVLVGGTLAWLSAKTGPVVNTFTAGKTEGEIEETFDGEIKKDVNVKNTGSVDAYVRIKLVSYRVDENDQPVGGEASINKFTPGSGWVEYPSGSHCYYYTKPVKANGKPETNLFDRYELTKYDDGSRQVLEVMAELIQSDPQTAVQDAWGVTISNGTVTPAGN